MRQQQDYFIYQRRADRFQQKKQKTDKYLGKAIWQTMTASKVYIEKTAQAPAPSKDFHQLVVSDTEVKWRTWRIAIRRDQRGIPPTQRKTPWRDFDDDLLLQSDISRVFGEDTLRLVHALVCGDWLVRLPPRIVVHIVSFLELEDIIQLGRVCRFLRKVCSSNDLWEKIYRTHCDTLSEETRIFAGEVGWKKVFFTNKLQLRARARRQKRRGKF